MEIGGKKIGKKAIFVIAIVVVIIIISFISSKIKQKKADEEAERLAQEAQEEIDRINQQGTETGVQEEYNFAKELQKDLVSEYGQPPEGFEWDMQGHLIALSDESSTPEDVMYYFVRSLSILDFSTAQRYSRDSDVVNSYIDYYSEISDSITDYYSNFLRKQYKTSLTSLEVISVADTAVFADGEMLITVNVRVLDLTDKDFWINDRNDLFDKMRVYTETETDDVKAQQYLYNYILSKYQDGTIGKKDYTIELKLEKNSDVSTGSNGWLVTGDAELSAILQYENGVDTAEYIYKQFEEWLRDKQLDEQLQQIETGH